MSPITGHHRKRDDVHPLEGAFGSFARVAVLAIAAYFAYDIRLFAVREYGRIIHEFDPWFNFRATQYLADNGWKRFSTWFDYMSWYPLGRPVGTTIYPGMQVTAVSIFNALKALGSNYAMSLNDVCVFFPAWFGAVATVLVAFLTAECSGSANSAVIAALVMSIVPAHTMRSVAGGYDNESLAVTAMCLTFFVWCRALRNEKSWWIGSLAGVAYVYMVAAWGGYTFVLNMVGLHAATLVLVGQYSQSLHKAYSLFWIIGTLGAIQFPVVGLAPIKSLEQLGPAFVFLGMQVLEVGERMVKSQKTDGRRRVASSRSTSTPAPSSARASASRRWRPPATSARSPSASRACSRCTRAQVTRSWTPSRSTSPVPPTRTGGTSTTPITSRLSVSSLAPRTT